MAWAKTVDGCRVFVRRSGEAGREKGKERGSVEEGAAERKIEGEGRRRRKSGGGESCGGRRGRCGGKRWWWCGEDGGV